MIKTAQRFSVYCHRGQKPLNIHIHHADIIEWRVLFITSYSNESIIKISPSRLNRCSSDHVLPLLARASLFWDPLQRTMLRGSSACSPASDTCQPRSEPSPPAAHREKRWARADSRQLTTNRGEAAPWPWLPPVSWWCCVPARRGRWVVSSPPSESESAARGAPESFSSSGLWRPSGPAPPTGSFSFWSSACPSAGWQDPVRGGKQDGGLRYIMLNVSKNLCSTSRLALRMGRHAADYTDAS